MVAAFAEKYLNTETSPSQPTTLSEEQSTETIAIEAEPAPAASTDRDGSEPPTPEIQQDAPSSALDVVYPVSPSFGIPLRRFVGR
jgi:hypothetical protein